MLCALVLAALPATAWAMAPQTHTSIIAGTVIDTTTCDIPFAFHWTAELRSTTFFDQAGSAIRLQLHINEPVHEITNWNTGATRTEPPVAYNVTTDLVDGSVTTVGIYAHVKVDDENVPVLGVGRIVVADNQLVFEAGQHNYEWPVSLCDAIPR